MKKIIATAVLGTTAGLAWGYEVRVRFVERVGSVDTVIDGDLILAVFPTRIRLQLGVFDDANGPAPDGGLYGWVNAQQRNQRLHVTRTPGRLRVYVVPEGGNGDPPEDPFIHLTNIQGVVGPQTLAWGCIEGNPLPMPEAVVRGRNTFVSVWEVTIDADRCIGSIEISGEAVAASGWMRAGEPVPPSCTEPPAPSTVVYEPVLLPGRPFTASLFVEGTGFNSKCPSDWNHDGVKNSQDFFDYLADFFAGEGEFNCLGDTNSQDFFDFLYNFFLDVC